MEIKKGIEVFGMKKPLTVKTLANTTFLQIVKVKALFAFVLLSTTQAEVDPLVNKKQSLFILTIEKDGYFCYYLQYCPIVYLSKPFYCLFHLNFTHILQPLSCKKSQDFDKILEIVYVSRETGYEEENLCFYNFAVSCK